VSAIRKDVKRAAYYKSISRPFETYSGALPGAIWTKNSTNFLALRASHQYEHTERNECARVRSACG
jgi:hypothetical protein